MKKSFKVIHKDLNDNFSKKLTDDQKKNEYASFRTMAMQLFDVEGIELSSQVKNDFVLVTLTTASEIEGDTLKNVLALFLAKLNRTTVANRNWQPNFVIASVARNP